MRMHDFDRSQPEPEDEELWLLQSDAATVAGCSVSAIRKWRRVGVIEDRTLVSPGGMRRVEVRLADVLARMRESMPRARLDERHQPTETVPSPVSVTPVPDLDLFVQHIAEAERRAAQAEALAQANDDMNQFLRGRVADLEAELQAARRTTGSARSPESVRFDASRAAGEIRRLRRQLQGSKRGPDPRDLERRAAAVLGYDAALICLCSGMGIPTQFRLGESLPPAERSRLTVALSRTGLDLED